MKTITRLLILVMVMTLLNSCDPLEGLIPSEGIFLHINNGLSDTVNMTLIFNLVDLDIERNINVRQDSILPSSEEMIYRILYDKDSICDTFKFIVNRMQEKQLTILTLTGDTLANWNDNSTIFVDKRYWTIEKARFGMTDMDLDCTFNLTDEVLKLK